MRHKIWKVTLAAALFTVAGASAILHAQQPAPDLILTNGKIITVDERFTIAQAVAVRGDRIVSVGTNQEIARLAGSHTKRIDLRGKAVIPGLIDAHAHLLRAAETWTEEVRLDGVDTRKEASEMIRARARAATPGQWIYNLGGWSIDQFSDDKKPFTPAELDQLAPNNPVLLQFTRSSTYLNTRAVQALGLDGMTEPWIVRDATGKPTGVIVEPGLAQVAGRIPKAPKENFESSSLALIRDLNRAGLTAAGIAAAGVGGCPPEAEAVYRRLQSQGRLNFRFFCMDGVNAGTTPEQVAQALPEIGRIKLYQGDNYIDHVLYGETVYSPLHDNMLAPTTNPRPDQLALWRTIATEVARAGLPLQVHATIEGTFGPFLDQIEAINKEYPIRNLRWAFCHMDQVTEPQIERMKTLGMYAAVGARPVVMGAIFNRAHGERSRDMPPLKMIQESGIPWGIHTDTTEVDQYKPFNTLHFMVTGKMIGGAVVNRQPISREDALIAYTRSNAYFIFREGDLGSIRPGKLADLVVLDRDYLTIPADQIKDIKPILTMVGGRIVYDASAGQATATR